MHLLHMTRKVITNCNCRDRTTCPVANKCLTTNVVYKATVKYEDKTQHYIGMTENSFKTRYTLYKFSIRHSNHRNQTELLNLIWSLTNKGLDYKLTWDIIDRARPYRPGKSTCNLCMSEKFHILVGKKTLSAKRLSCSISVPTAENSWRETTSHSFPRSTLTPLLTLVNTVLCVRI